MQGTPLLEPEVLPQIVLNDWSSGLEESQDVDDTSPLPSQANPQPDSLSFTFEHDGEGMNLAEPVDLGDMSPDEDLYTASPHSTGHRRSPTITLAQHDLHGSISHEDDDEEKPKQTVVSNQDPTDSVYDLPPPTQAGLQEGFAPIGDPGAVIFSMPPLGPSKDKPVKPVPQDPGQRPSKTVRTDKARRKSSAIAARITNILSEALLPDDHQTGLEPTRDIPQKPHAIKEIDKQVPERKRPAANVAVETVVIDEKRKKKKPMDPSLPEHVEVRDLDDLRETLLKEGSVRKEVWGNDKSTKLEDPPLDNFEALGKSTRITIVTEGRLAQDKAAEVKNATASEGMQDIAPLSTTRGQRDGIAAAPKTPPLINDRASRKPAIISWSSKGPQNQGSVNTQVLRKPATRVEHRPGNIPAVPTEDFSRGSFEEQIRSDNPIKDSSAEKGDMFVPDTSANPFEIVSSSTPSRRLILGSHGVTSSREITVNENGSPMTVKHSKHLSRPDHCSNLGQDTRIARMAAKPKQLMMAAERRREADPFDVASRSLAPYPEKRSEKNLCSARSTTFVRRLNEVSDSKNRLFDVSATVAKDKRAHRRFSPPPPHDDPERTLVTDHDKMFHSDSSTALDSLDSSESSTCIEDHTAFHQWRLSLQPYQSGMLDALHQISNDLVRHLIDKEDAIQDIIDEFESGGTKIVEAARELAEGETQQQIEILTKARRRVSAALDVALADLNASDKEIDSLREAESLRTLQNMRAKASTLLRDAISRLHSPS
ncbi:MAG: hypothetical protein M1817_001752 [Caeruleum heppii]|nr:MAG: hypothetical protein M1817_001752 [Caeruleum heppii]